MKKTLKNLVVFALIVAGFMPVVALAKEKQAEVKEIKKHLVITDSEAVKNGFKMPQFFTNLMLIKKTQYAAVKKVSAVYSVDGEATSIPSKAYMNALEEAVEDYYKQRAKAGGNKKKLETAELAYTQALEDAATLYLIPIEEQS